MFARYYNIIDVKTSDGDTILGIKSKISSSGGYNICGEINYFLNMVMFGITSNKGCTVIPVPFRYLLTSYLSDFLSFCGVIDKSYYEDEENEALEN